MAASGQKGNHVMSEMELLRALGDALRGPQRKPTVILLSSTVLMIAWWYLGSPWFYLDHFETVAGTAPSAAPAIYSFLACFVLLGLMPALVVKLVFRESLADYGVRLGDRKRTLRTFLLLGPVFLVAGYLSSCDPTVASFYPINEEAGSSPRAFGYHAFWYLLYYAGWEFHFRGFLQFGLRDHLGAANALLVQVMASSLIHFGKPGVEAFSAILGGILWGLVAYRTRSLLSGLGQHFLLGISLDFFLCYG